jgi:hypothetical protein
MKARGIGFLIALLGLGLEVIAILVAPRIYASTQHDASTSFWRYALDMAGGLSGIPGIVVFGIIVLGVGVIIVILGFIERRN